MGSCSIWHWLVVLVVVVLIFGTKKLRNVGDDSVAPFAISRRAWTATTPSRPIRTRA